VGVSSPPRPQPAPRAPQHTRRLWLLPAAGLLALLAIAVLGAVVAIFGGQLGCLGGTAATTAGSGPDPSRAALADIPPGYLSLYRQMGAKYHIDWAFLASIGAQESNHGRAAGINQANSSGCVGPMQLGVGGACGNFFAQNHQDGNGDGRADPTNPADAIATAAYGLRHAKHAPAVGGSFAAYRQAACGYYGACADSAANYADQVMARAVQYGFKGGGAPAPTNAATAAPAPQAGAGGCGGQAAAGGDLAGGDPSARALLANPKITFAHPEERADLLSGRISPRAVALLSAITGQHRITIFALASDHHPGTNHEAGRAADIAVVDGESCDARAHGRSGKCYALARQLAAMHGCLKPTELIYLWVTYPSPAFYGPTVLAEHADHIHTGYDGPLGPRHYPPGLDPCSPQALTGA